MARIVDEKEYARRRKEILDVAQRLVYSKGYQQMTIQDILDSLQISKGAFYHYFGSKQALLEALIEHIQDEAGMLIVPILQDAHLSAIDKLERFFATAARWKTEQKDFFLALLRVWYTDDNAIVRQKTYTVGMRRFLPELTGIIYQGIREGAFTTSYPDQVGEVLMCLLQGFGDALSAILLSYEARPDVRRFECAIAAYSDAFERVLGAPAGSLRLADIEMLNEWAVAMGDNSKER